jgi:hypothetical protein
MADTYGSRDANRFEVNKVQYYTLVDAKTGLITVKSPTVAGYVGGANADRTVGTIPATGANKGKFQFLAGNTTTEENAYFSKPENTKALKNQAEITANKAQQKEGVSPAAANARTNELLDNGKANTPTSADPDAAKVVSQADLDKDIATSAQGTRTTYTDVKYPLDLQANFQDCIKFAIIEYKPAGLGAQKSNGRVLNIVQTKTGQTVGDRKILGTITLPIPGGISDTNTVSWQQDTLNTIEKGFANVAQGIITKGGDGGTEAAKQSISEATAGGTGAAEAVTTSKFTEMATGVNVLGRKYGAVDNPNMELLFSGPSLRSFSFTFKLSPRSEREAVAVKTIIRSFKQAMSAKRTESTLLLKSPFTFAISYISGDKQHPYLNKFKECALTNCSVNYTPYGTYMTYAGKEKSMVAYELQLQFQELEPLFDDEYGPNDFDNIGF